MRCNYPPEANYQCASALLLGNESETLATSVRPLLYRAQNRRSGAADRTPDVDPHICAYIPPPVLCAYFDVKRIQEERVDVETQLGRARWCGCRPQRNADTVMTIDD